MAAGHLQSNLDVVTTPTSWSISVNFFHGQAHQVDFGDTTHHAVVSYTISDVAGQQGVVDVTFCVYMHGGLNTEDHRISLRCDCNAGTIYQRINCKGLGKGR